MEGEQEDIKHMHQELWEIGCGGIRSREGWEGFSAEGQVTRDLSSKEQKGGLQVDRCNGVQRGREASPRKGSVNSEASL